MEIQFLHETFTGKEPELLANHIRRLGSEEARFFPTTLSPVFDRLVEKTVARSVPSGSGLKKSIEIRNTAVHTTLSQVSTSASPTPAIRTRANLATSSSSRPKSIETQNTVAHTTLPQASTSTSPTPAFPTSFTSVATSFGSPVSTPAPVSRPVSPNDQPPLTWLACSRCAQYTPLDGLYQGLHCPKCPPRGKKGRPYMQCYLCDTVRTTLGTDCIKKSCQAIFL